MVATEALKKAYTMGPVYTLIWQQLDFSWLHKPEPKPKAKHPSKDAPSLALVGGG